MVEAGASAETIGHFAVHYPAKVAARLEPLPAPQELDLEAIIRATVQAVLGGGGSDAGAARKRAAPAQRLKVNVVVQGKRTSVKVRASVAAQLESVAGDRRIESLVQEFVDRAPAGHPNRSAWVEEQAAQYLVLSQLHAPGQSPGH